MTVSSLYLVINLGLRSNRVIVFNADGDRVAALSNQLRTIVSGERVEQNPEKWWSEIVDLISDLDDAVRESVGYITVTSSSCNLVCSDGQGKAVRDALMVSDKRSTEQAKRFGESSELSHIFESDNFSASASYIFPKIAWLAENEPNTFKASKTFDSSNSYLTRRFVGESVTDYLDAEKFYYDRTDGYPDPLLSKLSLDKDYFPRVVPIGTDIGALESDVASLLGLSPQTRFIITTYDALAAFWGAGATEVGDGANVCGTCSSLRTNMPGSAELDTSGSTIKAQYFSQSDVLAVGASNSIEGGVLEWTKSILYADSDLEDNEIFDVMESEARESPPGSNGLLFLPYLLGERASIDDPNARGMFFGLDRGHERSDMVRAVFESIGFLTRHLVSAIEDTGAIVDRLKVAGGLSRRNLACQLKADISGRPVILVDELENTALGCMIISRSTATGEDMRAVADDVVSYDRRFEPNSERHETYSKLYGLFRDLYESSKDHFKRRTEITEALDEGVAENEHQL